MVCLPLCVGMPVAATDHLDRERGILRGCPGEVVGWGLASWGNGRRRPSGEQHLERIAWVYFGSFPYKSDMASGGRARGQCVSRGAAAKAMVFGQRPAAANPPSHAKTISVGARVRNDSPCSAGAKRTKKGS